MIGNKLEFAKRMDGNLKYKEVLIDQIPPGPIRVLDFGCGSGSLTREIRVRRPEATIHALDQDIELLETAMERDAAHKYMLSIDHAEYYSYDVVILSSVIHEIENLDFFFGMLRWYVKKGGLILVRDGLAKSGNEEIRLRLVEPLVAKAFYLECGDSIIGNLDIRFEGDEVVGDVNDVRNFLQTYTWGFESLPREKNEKFLRLDKEGYKRIGKQIGAKTFIWEVCQKDYFEHLKKLVVLKDGTWTTHALVIYRMEER